MIKIRKPLCFSEIGQKENQEDYLFPAQADTSTRVFIMCDGMGGHDNGEVASRMAAESLGNYLSKHPTVDIGIFEDALSNAYDALDAIDTNSAKKPGTTMTCLCLNENSYLVAHIGDSRIYHIRPSLYDPATKRGGILYQSSDHSLVNDLLNAGELTEEEAHSFPQKNIITRAMQPHLEKRYKADIYEMDDIETGDYFFLCCDGVLEQLSNEALCTILADKKLDDVKKLAAIKKICDGHTRDNYTCWLVPIDKVKVDRKKSEKEGVILAGIETDSAEKEISDRIRFVRMRFRTFILFLIISLILGAAAGFAYGRFSNHDKYSHIEFRQETDSEKSEDKSGNKDKTANKRAEEPTHPAKFLYKKKH